ncbi:DUF5990 family protein [Caulobacter henricii]|uniref:Uncharacterized protein n=1 Tax=Caulobacter henricii TaxID=69395 RepID=A0A0N7JGY7_9CAUL|nr:DUF5990 family protein [Caulobacter henricii]ALL11906.1 hypothetical protein AQ619_00150 [Caulobacter henricii]
MARIDLVLRIILADPPPGVVFALQGKAGAPVDVVLSDGSDLRFEVPITLTPVEGGLRPGGPFLRADSRGRFVYVASGAQASCTAAPGSGRRAKIYLNDLADDLALAAAEAGDVLEARVAGRARDGGAACATVPLLQTWTRRPAVRP